MSKLKLFIENFIIYGFGSIINKVIPLIMVPIITRLMPTTEYFGLSDLSNTLISFASAFAIMGMYDAMYRMYFDNESDVYKKNVCSTSLFFTLITSAIVTLILFLTNKVIANYFFGDKKYNYLVYLCGIATFVGASNSIISAPTRMQNKRKIYLIANFATTLLSYGFSIPLLIKGYYVIALPLAGILSGIFTEVFFAFINHKWFSLKSFDKKLLKDLLVIAIPLLPNFLLYWVFNSCDKVMITNILNVGESGIYSVGSKLGHASQLIYLAFSGGWQFFAFSTMKEENQVNSNSKIFEYLGIISLFSTLIICTFSKSIYSILFPEEYLRGFIISSYLFLAPLLLMLYQVISNQFMIIKKTWPNIVFLSIGAISNILFNYILIKKIGIEGAAIATLIGYLISLIVCMIVLKKMKLFIIRKRFIICFSIFCIMFIIWRLYFINTILLSLISNICYLVLILFIYKSDLLILLNKTKKRVYNE